MFVGSDALALAPLTRRIAYLDEGDWAVVTEEGAEFFDAGHRPVERRVVVTAVSGAAVGKGNYRHFMEKELHEHPAVLGDTLRQYLDPKTLEVRLPRLPFDAVRVPRLTISACGSAFIAGQVGRYWIEQLARLPVEADVASELRYRDPPLPEGGGAVLVSQSGETADTLAALRLLRAGGQRVLSVVNVPESSMAREGDIALLDAAVPVVALCPSGPLFDKTASNLQEAAARGGRVMAFTDADGAPALRRFAERVVELPRAGAFAAPILHALPVQLLAYHVAVLKGTDVDQPRNLAKSVTVE